MNQQPEQLAPMHIVLCQPEPTEYDEWVTDITRVRDAGPELLRVLRKICAAETKPDLMMAITEGVTLCEKMPELEK